MRPVHFIASLLAFFAITCGGFALGRGGDSFERWYVIELMGQKAGYARIVQQKDGDNIRSINEMKLSIKRGTVEIKVELGSEWLETAAGQAISMTSKRVLGAAPETKVYTFAGDSITLSTTSNGKTETKTVARPDGEWLTPAARERVIGAALKKGEKQIVVRSVDEGLSGGLTAFTTTYDVLESTTVQAMGRTAPAVKWKVTTDLMPGIESIEYVDDAGIAIRTETDLGILKLVQIAADKDFALSKVSAPELLVSTLVKPDKPLKMPRKMTDATYLLSVSDGAMPDLPNLPAQRAERVNEKTVRLTVSRGFTATEQFVEKPDPVYLAASTMVDSTDARIQALAEKVRTKAGENASPGALAEAARRLVGQTITSKSLEVGFASATETARTRTGDCTEHGVLLTAMLRALDIPARVSSGLIYVDEFVGQEGIFGYHMWSQALLPDDTAERRLRWIDLDATLDNATPFDAAHINLGTSALSNEQNENFMVTLAPLLGKLKIVVEKVSP